MKLMRSNFAILLAVATFCAVTCDALNSEIVYNDPLALEHCVQLNSTVSLKSDRHTYIKAEYRNHKCSLACEYLEQVQYVSGCGRGGCIINRWYDEKRVHSFDVKEGQPCESKGICHRGFCNDADSSLGNLTSKINSIALNAQVYTKDTLAKCNTVEGSPGNSAIVLCIDSQRRNVTTLKEMPGFWGDYPFESFRAYEYGPSPTETCDLLYCFQWISYESKTTEPSLKCHYGTQFLSIRDNINFLFQKYADKCILDVIQIPLSELAQDHGKRNARVLQFTHIDVPLNVTLEWTGIIP